MLLKHLCVDHDSPCNLLLRPRTPDAVGAAWLMLVTERNTDDSSGVQADAARMRVGIVVAESSGAGLARWNGRAGMNWGKEGRFA